MNVKGDTSKRVIWKGSILHKVIEWIGNDIVMCDLTLCSTLIVGAERCTRMKGDGPNRFGIAEKPNKGLEDNQKEKEDDNDDDNACRYEMQMMLKNWKCR